MFKLEHTEKMVMTKSIDQSQKGGDGSQNIQIANAIINQGLQHDEVKDVALKVFAENFPKLASIARDTALNRANEVTEQYFKKLATENPSGFQQIANPDFQIGLYTVQKEYARTGDKDLGDLLVDLLVERSKCQKRDLLQIVLNECLTVASKLTEFQLSALSTIFSFRYVKWGVDSLPSLYNICRQISSPLVSNLTDKTACYQHLDFTGCGGISVGEIQLGESFKVTYRGLFTSGFTKETLKERVPAMEHYPSVPCLHDPTKIQFNAIDESIFREVNKSLGVDADSIDKAVQLWNENTLNSNRIKEMIIKNVPDMGRIFEVWDNSAMKSLNLTSVGIAIGHAHLRTKTTLNPSLAIWIN